MVCYGYISFTENTRGRKGIKAIWAQPGVRKRDMDDPYTDEKLVKLDIQVVGDGRKAKRKGAKRNGR